MTPQHIRAVWIKIAFPFGIALFLLVIGLVLRSVGSHALATPGAFLCLGGLAGMLLFAMKAIQFLIFLRNNKP